MKLSEYIGFDATGLAELIKGSEVSPKDLLACALEQSSKVNPKTNAVCRLMEEQATRQLQSFSLDAPFAGVPLLIKDGVQDYAGIPTSYGSSSMLGVVPVLHSNVVQRYLKAGFSIFGKTNLPEFALKAVTDSKLWGRANNPWDLQRTPGGSSGGSAAAVASGVVPMAAANDGGGSIRIPASYCGLFGLRPSRGRISSGPSSGEIWSGASSEGVISRTVRDTARALDVLHGGEPGDPFTISSPSETYANAMMRDPGILQIGYCVQSPIGTPVDVEAVSAVHDAVALLRGLGHEVEEQSPAVDGNALSRSYLHMYFGHIHAATQTAKRAGATNSDFELLTRILSTLGANTTSGTFVSELDAWNVYARALAKFHTQFDLLLTPTTATPAPLHGAADLPRAQEWVLSVLDRTGIFGLLAKLGVLNGMIDQIARDSLTFVPFTQLSNMTGTPSMSVPLYSTSSGLPMGVQFIARFGQEDMLLKLANQLQTTRDWSQKLPNWVVSEA